MVNPRSLKAADHQAYTSYVAAISVHIAVSFQRHFSHFLGSAKHPWLCVLWA